MTNENTDLTALPRLEEIADVIDLSNIGRLKKTKDRINTAFEVSEIVLDCIDNEPPTTGGKGKPQQQLITPEEFFGKSEDDGEGGKSDGESESENAKDGKEKDDEDAGTKMIKEISDVLSGRDKTPENMKENTDAVSKISENESEELKDLQKELESKQWKFLLGQFPKEVVGKDQKELLDLIDHHGIILVRVGSGLLPGDNKDLKVDCIVVQKMTKELILKGKEIFPLSGVMKMGGDPQPNVNVSDAVTKGIVLGTKLGRRLQIRREENPIKSLRKRSGKLNRRQLHEAAFDAEDMFYKVQVEAHNQATLHITVDASTSMAGDKWLRTMTAVVAICKAASMIENVHVTVSFRATQTENSRALPYVVMAYDSRVDKFSKVKSLFPYLEPTGCTPEGLAFEAIMGLFEGITPDEEERYFLNLSDGEPYYQMTVPQTGVHISYVDEVGVSHTRAQVNKIRRKGVEILSYFIEDHMEATPSVLKMPITAKFNNIQQTYAAKLRIDFQKMYGKNAKFINVESIVDLARTMNELFLTKSNESS